MPLFMDRHDIPGVTAEQVAEFHVLDLRVAAKARRRVPDVLVRCFGGFRVLPRARVECRRDDVRPSRVTRNDPNEIIPVVEGDVLRFLGTITDPANASQSTSPFRTVLFTDLEGSTSLLHELGQSAYPTLLAEHDLIIRRALVASRGREVKHTGDGIMAAFDDAGRALSGASAILDGFDERNAISPEPALRVRIGIAARRACRSQR